MFRTAALRPKSVGKSSVALTRALIDSLGGGAVFTRSTTGLYVDSNGTLLTAAINAPRYQTTASRTGLLLEAADTNLLLYSNDPTQDCWTKQNNVSFATGAAVSPSGATDAVKYILAGATLRSLSQAVTMNPASKTFTFSFWAKSIPTSTQLKIQITRDGVNFASMNQTITNSWVRYSLTGTANATAGTTVGGLVYDMSGDTGDRFYCYGFHLSQSPNLFSYIPTTTEAVARGADALSIPMAGIFPAGVPTKGTLLFEFCPRYANANVGTGDRGLVSVNGGAGDFCFHTGADGLLRSTAGTVALNFVKDTWYSAAVRWNDLTHEIVVSSKTGSTWTHGSAGVYTPFTLGANLQLMYGNVNGALFRNLSLHRDYLADGNLP